MITSAIRSEVLSTLSDMLFVESLAPEHWLHQVLRPLIWTGAFRISYLRKEGYLTSEEYALIRKEVQPDKEAPCWMRKKNQGRIFSSRCRDSPTKSQT